MNGAGRSCLAAGVALVGAGAIAVSPVAPPVQDIQDVKVVNSPVQLTARPFDAYVDLVGNSAANLAGAPVLEQVIANVEVTGEALGGGDPLEALGAVVGVVRRVNAALGVAAEAVVIAPYWAAVAAVFSTVVEGSAINQDLSEAVTAEDWLDVAYIVAETPARLVNAVLNGSGVTGGWLIGLQQIREAIADALAPNEIQPAATNTSDPKRAALVTVAIAQYADLPDVLTPTEGNHTFSVLPADEPTEEKDATVVSIEADSAEEDGATGGAEKTDDAVLVRESLKAEPGKIGMSPRNSDRPPRLKDFHDGIRGTVNDIHDGVRTFADRVTRDRGESSSSTSDSSDDSDRSASPSSDSGPSKDDE